MKLRWPKRHKPEEAVANIKPEQGELDAGLAKRLCCLPIQLWVVGWGSVEYLTKQL